MEHYVGLDVSLKLTAICIVDRTGKIEREGVVASDTESIAAFVKSHAPHVARVGLETGATSTWLWTELNKMGLPVICIDARTRRALIAWLSRSLTRTSLYHPHCMMRAMPTASLRSLLLICNFRAAFACLASMQMTGSPILFSSVHSHVDVAPVSSPTRATCGACDLTNAAMVSGSDATTPSRSIFPVRSTMQIAVSFSETSSPT